MGGVQRRLVDIVRHGHVGVVREPGLPGQRPAANQTLQLLTLRHSRRYHHEDDIGDRPERSRAGQVYLEGPGRRRGSDQVPFDLPHPVSAHQGRRQQGDVRRYPGALGVADLRPPTSQDGRERLRNRYRDADLQPIHGS